MAIVLNAPNACWGDVWVLAQDRTLRVWSRRRTHNWACGYPSQTAPMVPIGGVGVMNRQILVRLVEAPNTAPLITFGQAILAEHEFGIIHVDVHALQVYLQAVNPKPETLNPKPQTLNPKP